MKLKFCIIFLIFSLFSFLHCNVLVNDVLAFPWYPICYGMDSETPPVSECCELSTLSYSFENRHNCAMECLQDGGKPCCYDLCFVDIWKILTPNGIDTGNLYNAFSYGKEMTSQMSQILSNAMYHCLPKFYERQATTCGLPDGLYVVTKCIALQTLINCPIYTISERCDELKRIFLYCREKTTIAPLTPAQQQ